MRLIDAEHFINRFVSLCETDTDIVIAKIVCDALIGEPTAYDIDKVVDELEKELGLADKEKERCTAENNLQFDTAKGYASGLSAAIEIVKLGKGVMKNEGL